MLIRIYTIVCMIVVLGGGIARGQTNWPDFMANLKPGESNSPFAAELPANTEITPPAVNLPPEKASWSGKWHGWACKDRVCDTKLAVETISNEGAAIIYCFASEREMFVRRVQAKFAGNELRADIGGGASVVYRMRPDGNIDFMWMSGKRLISGILSKEK